MNESARPKVRIHPSALIEDDVEIGEETAIWDNVHVRRGARIGRSCILGEKTYVAYDVQIGDHCKLNAAVYVCAGVSIGDDCMLSAHVVFTNDLHPRAFDVLPGTLATSDPTEETLATVLGRGVTIGANATIGPGLHLGDFCMIGMGSVLTHDAPPHGLLVGIPARLIGFVCTCGPQIVSASEFESSEAGARFFCARCGRGFERRDSGLAEVEPPSGSDPGPSSP